MPILKLFIKVFIGKFCIWFTIAICFLFSQWFHWEGIKSGEAEIALGGMSGGENGTSLSTHYSFLFTSEIFFQRIMPLYLPQMQMMTIVKDVFSA